MHSNNEDPDGGYSDSRLLEIEREAAERSWYEKAEDLPQHSDWIDYMNQASASRWKRGVT